MICSTCSTRRTARGHTICDTCAFLAEAEERLHAEHENALTFDFVDPRTLRDADKRRHLGRLRRAIVASK